jgi:phosphoribosylformylglycinamidine synthase
MCFADVNLGANLTSINEIDSTKLILRKYCSCFQADAEVETFKTNGVEIFNIGTVTNSDTISIVNHEDTFEFSSKNIEKFGLKHPSY